MGFKKYFASTIQDLFSFLQKRLFKLPRQAVRVRVKITVSVSENLNSKYPSLNCPGSRPRKSLFCYGGKAEAINWRTNCPRGKPYTQFFSGPVSFSVPVACRRPNFSPVRAEGEAKFTSRMRKIDASQSGTIRKYFSRSADHV
jgi:hypothetical protein